MEEHEVYTVEVMEKAFTKYFHEASEQYKKK